MLGKEGEHISLCSLLASHERQQEGSALLLKVCFSLTFWKSRSLQSPTTKLPHAICSVQMCKGNYWCFCLVSVIQMYVWTNYLFYFLNRHIQLSPTLPCFLHWTSSWDVSSWVRRPHVPVPLCSCACSDVKGPQCPWQNPGRAIVRFHVVQTCFLLKQAKSSGWYHAAFPMIVSHNPAQGTGPWCAISRVDGQARQLVCSAAYPRL